MPGKLSHKNVSRGSSLVGSVYSGPVNKNNHHNSKSTDDKKSWLMVIMMISYLKMTYMFAIIIAVFLLQKVPAAFCVKVHMKFQYI